MTCIVIAEAGVNHNASLKIAKELVDLALASGADYVKFQTAVPEEVVTKHAKMAEYQITNTGKLETQLEMTKRIHLPLDDFYEIQTYCKSQKIGFLTTAFDPISLKFISGMGLDMYKVPSGEITNLPYLRTLSKLGKPIILSTGMSELTEIGAALSILISDTLNLSDITVLHCNSQYPTPNVDVNLRAMDTIRREFGVKVGYSDHTQGIDVAIAAVAMGASVIEKHFTLSRNMQGPDHKASLEGKELKQLVDGIKNVEMALGTAKKEVTPSESDNRQIVRKSIVAKTRIIQGETLTEENLTTKRPGTGLSPMLWDQLIGSKATKSYDVDDFIEQ
jgi:N,N'-diacetyllegionaminate synthase